MLVSAKDRKRGSSVVRNVPMLPASIKVQLHRKSVLNPTSRSASLITPIKMSTAIVGLMAPAKVSGTFPWIIRGSWEVQVYLVREPLRIGLKGVYFTRSAARGWGTVGSHKYHFYLYKLLFSQDAAMHLRYQYPVKQRCTVLELWLSSGKQKCAPD